MRNPWTISCELGWVKWSTVRRSGRCLLLYLYSNSTYAQLLVISLFMYHTTAIDIGPWHWWETFDASSPPIHTSVLLKAQTFQYFSIRFGMKNIHHFPVKMLSIDFYMPVTWWSWSCQCTLRRLSKRPSSLGWFPTVISATLSKFCYTSDS
jgi:hypothetical protein